MRIPAVKRFGALTVLSEKVGVNLNSSNQKLRLNNGDLQITIIPTSEHNPFVGFGSVRQAQRLACADRCEFKSGGAYAGCYVNHLKSKGAKVIRNQNVQLTVEPHNFVRATVWGDIGRLNLEGQEFVLSIVRSTNQRTAYISDFAEALPEFRNFAQASCQTREHVALAKMLGWAVYAGTKEARDALEGYYAPTFKCPVRGDGGDLYGCTDCKIACDGKRDVIAYTVHSRD